MARTTAIGIQDFEKLITEDYFYVDKTNFIKEWWGSGDGVTLITRPRRFGKTLNMSMLDRFFSNQYAGQGEIFEGLAIWRENEYQKLQGTYPVINLSFANIKEQNYDIVRKKICQMFANLYAKHSYLLDSDVLKEADVRYFKSVTADMDDSVATMALHQLSDYLYRYHGKKVIILLDEYDTPMQEAYIYGFWDDLVSFTRSLFNSTFKTNPYLERALMTGITRVSKESIFSDLNNLEVITTTSDKYATAFGFTEEEVFDALDEMGLGHMRTVVKQWYDGFVFGNHTDIYNPWSILNFLDKGKVGTYWANTSANGLVGKLIREGSRKVKEKFELLLHGEAVYMPIDEQIVYNQLNGNERAIFSLLLASGYLKVTSKEEYDETKDFDKLEYELRLTNQEVRIMFCSMVHDWFNEAEAEYSDFITALLRGNCKEMNIYMNQVALNTFSYFDTGKRPSGQAPERFYHGFVLGLIVELRDRYVITSNRESGYGRYDVMLEPKDKEKDDAIILEFKIFEADEEADLKETVQAALAQIEEKQYAAKLEARGIPVEKIRKYGFAFEGKKVLIGEGQKFSKTIGE